jgi:hypothetical protein
MKIKIVKCYGVGSEFANLIPGSVHKVLRTKKFNWPIDLWNMPCVQVMGVGKQVKVYADEYVVISE